MSPNGTATTERTCDARQSGKPHCYHVYAQPFRPTADTSIFPAACCYCAPAWLHYNVFVDPLTTDEDLTAEQMKHGHLVTLQRAPRRRAPIANPFGR